MRWRHYSCALIAFIATVGLVRADVSYYYALGQSYSGAVTADGSDPNAGTGLANLTNDGTSSGHAYVQTAGTRMNIPMYLVEVVTPGNVSPNVNTSMINMYFTTSNKSNFAGGVNSLSAAIDQAAAAFSPTGGSVGTSQIRGGSTSTLTKQNQPGQPNTGGFTFGKYWSYNFTIGTTATNGGSSTSQLFTNINDTTTGFNGNNLQVSTLLGTSQAQFAQPNGVRASNSLGVMTDATFTPTNASNPNNPYAGGTYGTGKILIGTVSITVGAGVTKFRYGPSTMAQLVENGNETWAGSPNPQSGITSLSSTSQSTLAQSDSSFTTTNAVSLDRTYNSDPTHTFHHTSSLYNTYTSIVEYGNGGNNGQPPDDPNPLLSSPFGAIPVAGPNSPSHADSFIPYYTGTDNQVVTFFVGSEAPAVPEPSSMALCGLLTAFGAGYAVKRRRKALAEAAAQTPAIA